MGQPTQTRITAAQYFALSAYENNDLVQLINGDVIVSMPPNLAHQIIVKKILLLLAKIEKATGGIAFVSPTEVYLDENNVFEPDLFYIKPEHLSIASQDEQRIIGAPDLVIEVLSPSTGKFDRGSKYDAYEAHGVGEYWIVDPVHETIEVWVLEDESKFARRGSFQLMAFLPHIHLA